MTGKNIKILAQIPVELIEAENVKSVVIFGETFEISEVISKAKIEAQLLINSNQTIFVPYTKEQLTNIINHY